MKSESSNIGPAEDDFVEDAGVGGEGDYSGADSFDDGGGDGGYGEMDPIAGTSGGGGVEDTKGREIPLKTCPKKRIAGNENDRLFCCAHEKKEVMMKELCKVV